MVFWLSCVNDRSALRNPDVGSVLISLESIFDSLCVFCEFRTSLLGIVTGGRVRRADRTFRQSLIVTAPCIERILDAFKGGNASAAVSRCCSTRVLDRNHPTLSGVELTRHNGLCEGASC